MAPSIYINAFAAACALGMNNASIAAAMATPRMTSQRFRLLDGREAAIATLPEDPAGMTAHGSRTNAITNSLLSDLEPQTSSHRASIDDERLAVIVGASTTGVGEGVAQLAQFRQSGAWPDGMNFDRQLLGDTSVHAADRIGAKGATYSVSTACTSSAKAMMAGARILQSGLADAVICGGVDAFTEFTLNGFAALESVSPSGCNSCSLNRDGIAIGEGGALFWLSREPGPWRLEGWAETSDAHHISAPDPTGANAERAVRIALETAGVTPSDIDHVHMHGTGTRLNDAMEAGLVNRVFGSSTAASSTKGMTGHTLGAAGAVQAALSLIAMESGACPPHVWDGHHDPELADIMLLTPSLASGHASRRTISMSFAFGGSNAALVLGRS